MADVSKLRRRSTLGNPPPPDEASPNLGQPEAAPSDEASPNLAASEAAPATHRRVIDGRTARRTNRTIQFATRVTPEWDERIRTIAQRDGLLLVEVLEKALDCYEAARKTSS